MVASSYIKLSITANNPGPGEDADPITADISSTKQYEYHALKSGYYEYYSWRNGLESC